MSEYTTIYLRNKATPLLEYKEHPSWNEIKDLSDDEINKIEVELELLGLTLKGSL